MTSVQYHTAQALFSQKHGGLDTVETCKIYAPHYVRTYTYMDGAKWLETIDQILDEVENKDPNGKVVQLYRCTGRNTDGCGAYEYFEVIEC